MIEFDEAIKKIEGRNDYLKIIYQWVKEDVISYRTFHNIIIRYENKAVHEAICDLQHELEFTIETR